MATVIDELIVALKLDSSQFNEGQQKAIQQLQGFETQAGQSMRRVGDSMKGFDLFTTAITNPLGALKRAFEDVARGATGAHTASVRGFNDVNQARSAVDTQARRSGEALRAGGMTAAEGYMALARAGLVAFAAIEALNKGMETAARQSAQMAGLGRAAWAMNLNPQWLGAFEMYAHQRANIAPEQTRSTLMEFEQKRQRYASLGQIPDEFQKFAYFLGLPADQVMNMKLPDLLRAVSAGMQGKNGREVVTQMEAIGLGTFAPLLRYGPQDYDQGVAANMGRAPTQEMTDRAQAFQTAWNTMEDAFTGLYNKLTDDANPAMVEFLNNLTALADWLANNTDILWNWLKNLLGAIPGMGLILKSMDAAKGVAAATEQGAGFWGKLWGGIKGAFGFGDKPAPAAAPAAPGPGGAAGAAPYENISRAEGTFGEGGINYNDTYGHQPTPKPLVDMTIAEAQQWAGQHGDAALGGFQEKAGTIGDAIKALNINPSEKFSPENQRRIADWIWQKQGSGAWSGFNVHPELRPSAGAPGAARGGPNAPGGAYGVPGAIMNYGGTTGALGAPGDESNLVTITDAQGNKARVNRAAAAAFQGFLADLEATGYKVKDLQGFANRVMRGGERPSEHAYGAAIDINPGANPFHSSQTDLPANIHDIAAKWGLVWGGDWSPGSRDTMHFQWGGPQAGTMNPAYANQNNPSTVGRTSTGAMVAGSWYHGGVSNDNSQTTTHNTIGPVQVTTGSGNPMMIGTAVQRALANVVTQANTGTQ